MKCIILAAGYATRLYPLTENFPKPLLKVRKKTILDWLLEDIDRSGRVDEYIVITNHKFADAFRSWAEGHRLPITVLDDFRETVLAASAFAGEGDVVILSPACSSFDRFKNFAERGNTFRKIVEELK